MTTNGSAPGALTLRNVAKSYALADRRVDVLRGIDLDVAPGELVSIVGPSGCGKSTLLRLIVGLEQDYQGVIALDDEIVRGTSLDRGIVFQDHRLFPWLTLEENVRAALVNSGLPAATQRARTAEILRLVGLGGFERAYPSQLSGGMAQRGAIARALINEPKLLLLDEPFGALDALTRLRMQQELLRVRRRTGATMVLVTHDVEEALFLGDRLVVMRAGAITQEVALPAAHPRDRASPAFAALKQEVLSRLLGIEQDGEASLSTSSRTVAV